MTNYHAAGKLTVKGAAHDVSVGDDGRWYTWLNSIKLEASTKDELAKVIGKETRKATATVAVPFTQLDGGTAKGRRGVATGVHSRSRNVLVRWSDTGESGQLSGYGDGTLVGELTDEELQLWETKRLRHLELLRWLDDFEQTHRIGGQAMGGRVSSHDLHKAVKAALEQAVGGTED